MPEEARQPTPSNAVGLDPRLVISHAEEVGDLFRVQLEKGLFCGEDADKRAETVANLLVRSYLRLREGRPEVALNEVLTAERIILDAYYKRSKNWRFFHRYQPFLLVYYILLTLYLFVLGGNLLKDVNLPGFLVVPQAIWGVPLEVLAFGAGGAILRGFYWFSFKVGRRQFRPHFQLAYYVAPWIGALFGALVYVVIRAGLWTFQGSEVSFQEPWAVLGLAALSGYSWEWVTGWLDRIMKKVFSQEKSSGSPVGEKPPPPKPEGDERKTQTEIGAAAGHLSSDSTTSTQLEDQHEEPPVTEP